MLMAELGRLKPKLKRTVVALFIASEEGGGPVHTTNTQSHARTSYRIVSYRIVSYRTASYDGVVKIV